MAGRIVGAACSTISWTFCLRCTQDRGIPQNVHEVSLQFLTQALRSTGKLEAERAIIAIEVREVGDADRGMLSDTAFLGLTFDGESRCPASMVCKMAGLKTDIKILMKLLDMVGSEIGFLRMQTDARNRANIRVPQLYYAYHNQRTQHFIILMEDLRPAKPGKQLNGCQMAEARSVLRLLAQLHGKYWENYDEALAWTVPPNHPKKRFVDLVIRKTWPKFRSWAVPHVDAGRLPSLQVAQTVMEQIMSSGAAWMQEMATPPLSVIHGDCHSENFLWPQEFAARDGEAIAIDFQLSTIGQPLFDVANFLLMSVDSDLLQQQEDDLLLYYHTQLITHISTEFSMTELRKRYTAGMCYTLALEVIGQGTQDSAELADETLQSKRLVIFNRILSTMNRTTSPTMFFSRCAHPPENVPVARVMLPS